MWTWARWKVIGSTAFIALDYTVTVLALFAVGLISTSIISEWAKGLLHSESKEAADALSSRHIRQGT